MSLFDHIKKVQDNNQEEAQNNFEWGNEVVNTEPVNQQITESNQDNSSDLVYSAEAVSKNNKKKILKKANIKSSIHIKYRNFEYF